MPPQTVGPGGFASAAANALQEGLGGQFSEMRTMMKYLFQSFNFRGKAKQYSGALNSPTPGV